MKLTTTQKRAKRFCDIVKDNGIPRNIVVEWKRSRTWGSNPVVESDDGKMCNVSGCGYCKLSTALADVLCFLFTPESDEFNAISRTGGAGVNSVIGALDKTGWTLEQGPSGKAFDCFTLRRKTA